MPVGISPHDILKYTGPKRGIIPVVEGPRVPNTGDTRYPLNTFWRIEKNPQSGAEGEQYILVKFENNGDATWQKLATTSTSGDLDTLSGDSGTSPVVADGAGNIAVTGAAARGVSSTGGLNSLEFTVELATDVQVGVAKFNASDFDVAANGDVTLTSSSIVLTITGDNAAASSPVGGNFDVLGRNGIVTTSSAGQLLIAAPLTSVGTFTEVTSATVSLAAGNGYILNRTAGVTATLPTTCTVGDVIRVVIKTATTPENSTIAQNASQTIHFGVQDTTTGAGGSLAPTLQYDSIEFVCTTTNTDFIALTSIGDWTVV